MDTAPGRSDDDGMKIQEVTVGRFYDLIQQHMDSQDYDIKESQVAKRLGVTQTTLTNWRTPKKLVAKRHIIAVANLTGVRYATALDALLSDIGYLSEDNLPDPEAESESA